MSSVGKLSREEFRRQKDLDAARKAGTAPAEVDEEGNAINPHIPQFMAQAPWYLDSGRPSLKHQRKPEEPGVKTRVALDEWYARGQKAGPAASKYRKGACENCGALSHKTRDCLERPRKKGAKWSGKDIAADEVVKEIDGLDRDWDAKRDRWNGYDPSEHKRVLENYEAIEAARQKLREEEIDRQGTVPDGGEADAGTLSAAKKLAKKSKKGKEKKAGDDEDSFGTDSSDEEDEDKYTEKANMVGQKVDTVKRISVRNLRIREDRAKYLYNLNPESAYYDPKTRSMREAPDPNQRPEDASYAGDNFHRASGDVLGMQKLQLFAWQAESRGTDVHLQANPTVNELQFKQYQERKDELVERNRSSVLERYGGAEHFDSVPKELRDGQSEAYVEYSRTGQVIKGQERAKPRTKYEEDVLEQNHTHVWGSWYDLLAAQWGYGCCRSTMRGSYCTGKAGIEAAAASSVLASIPAAQPADAAGKEKSGGKAKAIDNGKRASRGRSRSRSPSFSSSSRSSYSSASESESDRDDKRRRQRRASSSRSEEDAGRSSRRRRRSRSYSSDSGSDYSSASSARDSDRRSRRRSHKHKSSKKRKTAEGFVSRKDIGEGDVSGRLDKRKLKEALRAEDERRARAAGSGKHKADRTEEADAGRNGRRGGYNSLKADDANVTEEQLEAYRMKRQIFDDPMANFKDHPDAV